MGLCSQAQGLLQGRGWRHLANSDALGPVYQGVLTQAHGGARKGSQRGSIGPRMSRWVKKGDSMRGEDTAGAPFPPGQSEISLAPLAGETVDSIQCAHGFWRQALGCKEQKNPVTGFDDQDMDYITLQVVRRRSIISGAHHRH